MDLKINSFLVIPSKELKWRFSRSPGPGGQNSNKVESRVELVFNLEKTLSFNSSQKQLIKHHLGSRLVDGCLRVVVSKHRTQYLNREVALIRLSNLLNKGLDPLKTRRSTRPRKSSQERRLELKKQRGELKRRRQIKSSSDEWTI